MITKRAYPVFNPSFFPVDNLNNNQGLKKEASLSSDTLSFVEKHAAENDKNAKKALFIVNGLGASDYYSMNRNGDAFFEKHLTGKQTPAEAKKNRGEYEGKCLPRYKTFVNGYAFEHHKNDDPENSIGDLLTSFWNDKMKRVEVIAKLDESKADDVLRKYHNGEPIAWSMGARVPHDICNICKNKAPSRRQYCKHLKNEMGQVRPDGTAVYAINDKPRFFDLSIVTIPADQTAYTLKVVGMNSDTEPNDGTDLSPDEQFIQEFQDSLNKAAESKESKSEKESDIVKEIIGVDAENMDFAKVCEKYMNEEINKEDFVKILSHEMIGEKTARVIHEAQDHLDFSQGMEKLQGERLRFEDFIKISDMEVSSQLQRALGEAGAITPGNPPLPNVQESIEESEDARNRAAMAVAGSNAIADILWRLRNSSTDELRSFLQKRPGIVNFLLSLLAGTASAGISAVIDELTGTGTPDTIRGQIAG